MKRRGSGELFNYSMLDVLACTIGFLLLILFTLTIVSMQLRPPTIQQKLLGALEERITELRSEILEVKQEGENLERKLERLQTSLEKERWWHNWIKIALLIFFLLTLSVYLLIYVRWRWLRRGRGIESYGEIVEKGVVRFIVGCYRDYIVIGSGPVEAIRILSVLLLTLSLIVTLLVKPSWFLILPIASVLAIAVFFPFRSTKVPVTDLERGGTPFHRLCNFVREKERKCRILFWVYPGGGRSFHAALRVMKECGIHVFSMNISE